MLTLKGKPLGQDPEVGGRISEDVQMILADNHGHLGRRVAQYLVANRGRHSEIQAVFREARGKYASISTLPSWPCGRGLQPSHTSSEDLSLRLTPSAT